MKRITTKSMSAAGLLLTLVAGLAFASAPASAEEEDSPSTASIVGPSLSGEDKWTPEMRLSASEESIDVSKEELTEILERAEQDLEALPQNRTSGPVTIVDSAAPALPFVQTKVLGTVYPATVGKLFTIAPNGELFRCTAAVINSEGKNLVYTAAHCVYNKNHAGQTKSWGPDEWHSDFEFIPAYHIKNPGTSTQEEKMPYGAWHPEFVVTFDAWIDDHDRAFDQAFMLMEPNAGGFEIADVVGGNGMTYNEERGQYPVQVWGYPVLGAYATQTHKPHTCPFDQINPSDQVVPGGVRIMCDMTPGSSGGPWIKSFINKNRGMVIAVTSGRVTGSGATMHGAPNTPFTAELYDDLRAG